jgi:hypothetical protein
VILSKNGMAALLGDHALDALSTYFGRIEDERCENLLSIEQALGARKRKREDDTAPSVAKQVSVVSVQGKLQ